MTTVFLFKEVDPAGLAGGAPGHYQLVLFDTATGESTILEQRATPRLRAGGHASIGGHGEQWGLDSHWEVWGYAEALEPIEALEMASLGGAYMAGLEDDLGSIEAGKLADLVILNSNPLETIANTIDIAYVMKGGRLFDDDTLDEVWPKTKPYGTPPWLEEEVYRTDTRSVDHWDQ